MSAECRHNMRPSIKLFAHVAYACSLRVIFCRCVTSGKRHLWPLEVNIAATVTLDLENVHAILNFSTPVRFPVN